MGIAIVAMPAARPEGFAAFVKAAARPADAWIAAFFGVVVAGAAIGPNAVMALAAVACTTALVCARAQATLGGLTGDVCGAIGETAVASGLVALTLR
jgi:adenosylcobinamide-GDP ribazoletransferase